MDILISASRNASVKVWLVNWLPWPVLNIFGAPYHSIASFRALMQKSASIMLDKRQLSTWRIVESITANRYRKPFCIGI